MSFFRIFLLSCLLSSLAACGFQPIYGKSDKFSINEELSRVQIISIPDRVGQIVHNLLLDRLNPNGRSAKQQYTLNVIVDVARQEIGIKFTEEATRATLTLKSNYILTNIKDGRILTEGKVRSVNSYNISDSEFARISSEHDATERAAREVSDEIKTRLSLYFSRKGA